jgi:hypothetical protein
MARILVQTNDYRTVLDERDVQLADISDERSAGSLRDRLERAVQEAERRRVRRNQPLRRVAVIVPATDYRAVSG